LQLPATGTAYGGWSEGARERAGEAAVPQDVDLPAARSRGETEAAIATRANERREQTRAADAAVEAGREDVESERTQPMAQQVLEEVPLVGGWLAGRIYGTARNEAPDVPGRAANGSQGVIERPSREAN
ncbi:MAG: hypothetical protein OXJ56_17145, partial [Rhodospirillaceae bacterium]|nr:hypothetical protein [Rhodospirillaceae bacterium]